MKKGQEMMNINKRRKLKSVCNKMIALDPERINQSSGVFDKSIHRRKTMADLVENKITIWTNDSELTKTIAKHAENETTLRKIIPVIGIHHSEAFRKAIEIHKNIKGISNGKS